MAFVFESRDLSVECRRVALEQTSCAMSELASSSPDRETAIHEARKRFKRIRALLRLVRGNLGVRYKRENARFRDMGRELAAERDAHVVLASFDALQERLVMLLSPQTVEELRRQLVLRRDQLVASQISQDLRVTQVLRQLREAETSIQEWHFQYDDFSLIRAGLKRIYGLGRRAMKRCERIVPRPSVETGAAAVAGADTSFHEWRKVVKYQWYHTKLLRNLWREPLQARAHELAVLSDLLGVDHDLAVLRTVLEESAAVHALQVLPSVHMVVGQRQAELRAEAHTLGRRLYALKPKTYTKAIEVYWTAR